MTPRHLSWARPAATAIAAVAVTAQLTLAALAAQATVVSPAGGSSETAVGVDAGRGCVYNGFDYAPASGVIAEGPHCYTTPDSSTIPRLAPVDPARTSAQLAAVQASSPLDPDSYLAAGTVATRTVAGAPRAANSAQVATYVQDLPRQFLPDQLKDWLRTSVNGGNGVGGHDNIPLYTVDSANPAQSYATFTTTDSRVTTFPKLYDITTGRVPLPTWATPSDGGDRALAVLDRGTGIYRTYFGVTQTSSGTYSFANAGYLYTDGVRATADNYWLGLVQGGSSVVGLANGLTQIGAEEVSRGSIDHLVSVTLPSSLAGVISFPAKATDGRLTDPNAPAKGQVFTLPPDLDIDALGLNPLTTQIAKAVQKHGGIVADQNLWCMAFNLESPKGMGPDVTNPWASGGAAYAKLGGNLDVNDFPWSRTQWLPVGYAGRSTTVTPVATLNAVANRHEGVGSFALSGALAHLPAGSPVTVQVREPGSSTWVTRASTTSSSTGTFTAAVPVRATGTYAFRAVSGATVSATRTAGAYSARVAPGATSFSGNTLAGVAVTGRSSAGVAGVKVALQVWTGSAWKTLGASMTGTGGAISMRTAYGLGRLAIYTHRLYESLPNTGRVVVSSGFAVARVAPAAGTRLTQSQVLTLLSANGVGVTSPGRCYTRTVSSCTGLATMFARNVSGLVRMRRATTGVVLVGGTEVGWPSGTYSHWNGYRAAVARTTSTNAYVGGLSGTWTNGSKYVGRTVYTPGKDHWDITYLP